MAFIDLIENYIILKEKNKDLYYDIVDNSKKYRKFIDENLAYNLIIKDNMIKLEKIPAFPEKWMGIKDFNEIKEYIFFVIILMFLQDKQKGEQFILSNITEYIEHNYKTEKIDWTVFKNRKSLVNVIKFALKIGIIKNNDGNEEDFMHHESSEILYENTGISKYVLRNFSYDIDEKMTAEDLAEKEEHGLDTDKGTVRKNKVYRELLLNPAVFEDSASDSEYIRKYRSSIRAVFEENLEWDVQVHRNMACVCLKNSGSVKDVFPNTKGESMAALFAAGEIRELVKNNELMLNEKDCIIISEEKMNEILIKVREKYGMGFTKNLRDMGDRQYTKAVKDFMEEYSLLKTEEGRIRIMPLTGKFKGKYPEDYNM